MAKLGRHLNTLPNPKTATTTHNIGVKQAQNAAVLVNEAVVEAGSYNWIDFKFDDSDVTKSYAMTLAGGMEPVDFSLRGIVQMN